MYTGSIRITNQVFEEAYENSNSSEFKALAKKVVNQVGLQPRKPLHSVQYDVQMSIRLLMSCQAKGCGFDSPKSTVPHVPAL